MSSCRPISSSEIQLAAGQPIVGFLTFFGVTQGMILHLNSTGIKASSGNWVPNQAAKMRALWFIGGCGVGSYYIAKKLFSDASLQRLVDQHALDKGIAAAK
tara:strand:- start:85 stop:387 length:303 start_codon:yes stop_codon:yes gene_type:complete